MRDFIYRGLRLSSTPRSGQPSAKSIIVLANDQPLRPNDSLAVFDHSPDGFEWGYLGSGPAQLSLAILLHYFRYARGMPPSLAKANALTFYQPFKERTVARWRDDEWEIDTNTIILVLGGILRDRPELMDRVARLLEESNL